MTVLRKEQGMRGSGVCSHGLCIFNFRNIYIYIYIGMYVYIYIYICIYICVCVCVFTSSRRCVVRHALCWLILRHGCSVVACIVESAARVDVLKICNPHRNGYHKCVR